MYVIIYSETFEKDVVKLKKSEPKLYSKLKGFIIEVSEHPRIGTGKPEPLKGLPGGRWSRRLNKKHRLVYRILEEEKEVHLLSAYGHYDDK